jgi:hypothetical protein
MVTPVLHIPYCLGNIEIVSRIFLNGYYENTAHVTLSWYRQCYLLRHLKIDSQFRCFQLTVTLIFTHKPH